MMAMARGLLVFGLVAVVWLSGGCEQRTSSDAVDVPTPSGEAADDRGVPSEPSPPEEFERPKAAADAVEALRLGLGAALREAMSKGGPAAAIDACRLDAPRITASLDAPPLTLGRTSHRLRNPANAPQPWVLPLLEAYRTAPPQPGTFRVVDLGEAGLGYVEPIYLQPLCATCHGEDVAPNLLAKIRSHYPDDRATGFRPGEFRGLFWAVFASGGN